MGTQLDGYQLHMNPNCKSGYRHVLHDPWVNKKHPWRAKVGGTHLGSFDSPEEAAVAVAKHLGDEPVGGGEAEAEEVEMEDGRPTEVRASTCCLQPPRRTEICRPMHSSRATSSNSVAVPRPATLMWGRTRLAVAGGRGGR